MSDFTIELPDAFEDAVHLTKDELQHHIRLMAALKMFELGKIAAGKASELAGLSKSDFYSACKRYKVSIYNYPDDEVEKELSSDVDTIKRMSQK